MSQTAFENGMNLKKGFFFLSIFFLTNLAFSQTGLDFSSLKKELTKHDAVLVQGSDGSVLFSHNPDAPLVPASILKMFTTLLAFDYLGEDYKFKTEFYLDDQRNLTVKGYGDPLLISEELIRLSKALSACLPEADRTLHNLVLDSSYFQENVTIPGVSRSLDPYNAPNSALCVNFNTVNFRRNKTTHTYESAEPQTPLLPIAMKRIKESPAIQDRIFLSSKNNEHILYAGHLMAYFFEQEGIRFDGIIGTGKIDLNKDGLIYTFKSDFSLPEVCAKLLYFSNNFMANQLFLTVGAKVYGPPATLEKGVKAAGVFAEKNLGIPHMDISEGSGISRKNTITATAMMKIVAAFSPHMKLLKNENNRYFKTGTLQHVSTQAGFIMTDSGNTYRYVVMRNGKGASSKKIVQKIVRLLK